MTNIVSNHYRYKFRLQPGFLLLPFLPERPDVGGRGIILLPSTQPFVSTFKHLICDDVLYNNHDVVTFYWLILVVSFNVELDWKTSLKVSNRQRWCSNATG